MQRLTAAQLYHGVLMLAPAAKRELVRRVLEHALDEGIINPDDRVFEALRKTRPHERPHRFFTGRLEDDV